MFLTTKMDWTVLIFLSQEQFKLTQIRIFGHMLSLKVFCFVIISILILSCILWQVFFQCLNLIAPWCTVCWLLWGVRRLWRKKTFLCYLLRKSCPHFSGRLIFLDKLGMRWKRVHSFLPGNEVGQITPRNLWIETWSSQIVQFPMLIKIFKRDFLY